MCLTVEYILYCIIVYVYNIETVVDRGIKRVKK